MYYVLSDKRIIRCNNCGHIGYRNIIKNKPNVCSVCHSVYDFEDITVTKAKEEEKDEEL